MHTVMVIAGGLVLLAAMLALAKLGGFAPLPLAALIFLPIWLIIAVINLWVGVTRAGYTVAQELPILLVVFGVPAAVALAVRYLLRA